MKHFRKEVLTSHISFFSRGTRTGKKFPKLRIALCCLLSLSNILYPCATAKAWDFQYVVGTRTFSTPYYRTTSRVYLTESEGTIYGYVNAPPDPQIWECTTSVNITGTYGALSADKAYRILVKFDPVVKFQSSDYDGDGHKDASGVSSANYYLLVGGQRYDFGISPYLYIDVTGVTTDNFIIGADLTSACTNYQYETIGQYWTDVWLNNISYNIIEWTGYPDYGTKVLDTSIQQTNGILSTINTVSVNTYNELVKQTPILTTIKTNTGNIYTELKKHTTALNSLDAKATTANSTLSTISTGIKDSNLYLNHILSRIEYGNSLVITQNSLINKTNELLEQMTGGYDSSVGNGSLSDFDDTMSDFENAQSSITDSAFDSLDDYTINDSGLIGMSAKFANTIPLVSGMMQSMFESSGELGTRISVSFTLTIVAILAGLFKFFKR